MSEPTSEQPRQPNVYERLAACIEESGAIAKTGKAPQQAGGYAFHRIDDVVEHLRDILLKHGLAVIPSVTSSDVRELSEPRQGGGDRKFYHAVVTLDVGVVSISTPSDGFVVRSVGDGIDYGDKSTGKAYSYALKTAMLALFQLRGQPDNEDDDHDHAATPAKQPATVAPPATRPPANVPSMDERKKAPWAVPDLTQYEGKLGDWKKVTHHKRKNRKTQQLEPAPLGDLDTKEVQWWADNWCLPMTPTKEDMHLRVALNIARKDMAVAAAGESSPPSAPQWPPPEDQIPF